MAAADPTGGYMNMPPHPSYHHQAVPTTSSAGGMMLSHPDEQQQPPPPQWPHHNHHQQQQQQQQHHHGMMMSSLSSVPPPAAAACLTRNVSGTSDSNDGGLDGSWNQIKVVQDYIERCLQQYLSQVIKVEGRIYGSSF